MIIAFQIILLVIIVISFFEVVGEKEDGKLRDMLAGVFMASLAAFILSGLWL